MIKTVKVYIVKCPKWRKCPSGFRYYVFEPSDGLIQCEDIDESLESWRSNNYRVKFVKLRLKP